MRVFRRIAFVLALLGIIALIPMVITAKRMDEQLEKSKNRLLSGSFTVIGENTSHAVKAFSDGTACYLFLPKTAKTLSFSFDAHHVLIDEKEYRSGDTLALNTLDGLHSFCFVNENGEAFEQEQAEFILSGDIPTIYIDSGSGQYVRNEKEYYKEYCAIEIVDTDGTVEYRSVNAWSDRIRGRGNTTWQGASAAFSPKNPYNLYLKAPADLFGMGEAEQWALLANAYDASNLRNRFFYDYAREIGLACSPESVSADVYIDGEYRGVYQLSEKPQVGPGRVDIAPEGVLFKMEISSRLSGKPNEYITPHAQGLVREYPEINSEKWTSYFAERMDAFDKLLFSDFSLEEMRKEIDIDSWVRMGILEELSSNSDAWATSQYFYIKPGSDIIYAGPVWDMDFSSGNHIGNFHPEKCDLVNNLIFRCETSHSAFNEQWFSKLMKNREFYECVSKVFSEEIYPGFADYLNAAVDAYQAQLGNSQRMNSLRWGLAEDDAEYFRAYMLRRAEFLKRIWGDDEPYCTVTFYGTGISPAYFKGEVCTPDVYYYTWYYDPERTRPAEAFVPEQDTVLYAEVDLPIMPR